MNIPNRYALQRYLFLALDPIHAGAGGYRLGRVDNSIAREPGTRLPKIPGTSLHGAARTYAAYLYETPEAAGQSQEKVPNPPQNPICYTFGYIKKGKEMSSGVVNLFDAHLLLFPVHSMAGPVWVSTLDRLNEAGFTVGFPVEGAPEEWPAAGVCLSWPHSGGLNLGWLLLDAACQVQVQPPTEWQGEAWNAVSNRIALVSQTLFGAIVNSNLEVRTSVAINPETGAAEEGALYTYEAIPRAAFLTAEVVLDDYRQEFPQDKCGQGLTENGNPLPGGNWHTPLDVVKAGLKMIEYLSVGGMGTRGFGRMKIIGQPKQESLLPAAPQERQP
jgi:CRISPR-associated protein Cmr4